MLQQPRFLGVQPERLPDFILNDQSPQAQGLLHFWPLVQGRGPVIDVIGDYNGEFESTTGNAWEVTEGPFFNCLDHTGTTSRIQITGFTLFAPLTLLIWVNIQTTDWLWGSYNPSTGAEGIGIVRTGSPGPSAILQASNRNNGSFHNLNISTAPQNEWIMVVFTIDGSGNKAGYLYSESGKTKVTASTTLPPEGFTGTWHIGGTNGVTATFTGQSAHALIAGYVWPEDLIDAAYYVAPLDLYWQRRIQVPGFIAAGVDFPIASYGYRQRFM